MWEILGIDPTEDVREIKRAYAKRLKVYHPEDDPEGFQRLREAYDRAVKQAGRKQKQERLNRSRREEDDGVEALVEEAGQAYTSPPIYLNREEQSVPETELKPPPRIVFEEQSIYDENENRQQAPYRILSSLQDQEGPEEQLNVPPHIELRDSYNGGRRTRAEQLDEFMERLEALYADYDSRLDLEQWRVLLDAEVMWQVGGKEQLNDRVLDFLEDHHYLPRTVWNLLEQQFQWLDQLEELSESCSAQWVHYLQNQLNAQWELRYSFLQAAGTLEYDTFLHFRELAFFALLDGETDRAGQLLDKAYELYAQDPDLLRLRAERYERTGEYERALGAAEELIGIVPDELDGYLYRSRLLFRLGRPGEAAEVCRFILDRFPASLDSLALLAKCRYEQRELSEAKTLFNQVLEQNPVHIEARTYLAQINADLLQDLKASRRGANRQQIDEIQKEIMRPGKLPIFLSFIYILIRRTWIYALFLIVWQFTLHAQFVETTGTTPLKYAVQWLTDSGNSVIIETGEQLDEALKDGGIVTVRLTGASYMSMLRIYVEDDAGHKQAKYAFQNEVADKDIRKSSTGYTSVGYVGDRALVVVTDYDQAMEIYKNKTIELKTALHHTEGGEVAAAVHDYAKRTKNVAYADKLTADFYGDSNVDWQDEKQKMLILILFAIVLPVIYAFLLREVWRSFKILRF
ncbi:J domain-containing protein [Paenibacillus sp. y28]|uniref:J domain-containing protein n=1 Tax=Paenibacillus sp. y28 TaxID=3129110 RepID=UPI00301B4956